jgi:hypothetical protein
MVMVHRMLSFPRKALGILSLVVLFAPSLGLAYEMAPNGTIVQATCSGGVLPICGILIPMPATTSVGNTAEVHVPPDLLGDTAKTFSFTVECVDNGNGGAAYQAVNINNISCNVFPCQTSTVRLCDTNIQVNGGTPLGGIVRMTMPLPTAAQPFTVQCVGKEGGPPVYQISDHSAVTCAPPPAR